MKHLGNHLREIRKSWGKSLKDISEFCDISIDYLSKIEMGDRTPTDELLKKISKYYSISFQELKEIQTTDEILTLLEEVEDEKKVLRLVRKRLKNPDYHIHIRNSHPLKKEKPKRKYVKGGKGGKVKGFNYYIQSNDKLKKRERRELIKKSEEYMGEVDGSELDPSLTDHELMSQWNEFFDEHGMKFPEFEDRWFRENPIPDDMKQGKDDDKPSTKPKLPKSWKKRKKIDSDLG